MTFSARRVTLDLSDFLFFFIFRLFDEKGMVVRGT